MAVRHLPSSRGRGVVVRFDVDDEAIIAGLQAGMANLGWGRAGQSLQLFFATETQ